MLLFLNIMRWHCFVVRAWHTEPASASHLPRAHRREAAASHCNLGSERTKL